MTALQRKWGVIVHARPESAITDLGSCGAAVFVAPDLGEGTARRGLALLRLAAPGMPLVLCTGRDPLSLVHLADIRVDRVLLLGQPDEDLLGAVAEAMTESVFRDLNGRVRRRASHVPVVVHALDYACRQRPPSEPDAVEMLARGEPVFIRTVAGVAKIVGCHPDYLSRASGSVGIGFARFLRWVTVLRGLDLHASSRVSWTSVATRLGFDHASAWSHYVRRLLGRAPTELSEHPVRWWSRRALTECVSRDVE